MCGNNGLKTRKQCHVQARSPFVSNTSVTHTRIRRPHHGSTSRRFGSLFWPKREALHLQCGSIAGKTNSACTVDGSTQPKSRKLRVFTFERQNQRKNRVTFAGQNNVVSFGAHVFLVATALSRGQSSIRC